VRDVAVPALALGVWSGRDRNVGGDLPSSSIGGSELDAGAGARSREATASGVATRVLFVAEFHQRLELADDVRVAPEPEVSVNALLRHGQPQLVEPRDLRPRERLTCGLRPEALPAMASAARGAATAGSPTTRPGTRPTPARSRRASTRGWWVRYCTVMRGGLGAARSLPPTSWTRRDRAHRRAPGRGGVCDVRTCCDPRSAE